MILHVANPIYDSVFKYIMSDERISKTVLSALLKKEVVKVEMRPHEYSNTTRDTLSMFRIDFAATIRERNAKDGELRDRVVLIELQKTWLDTETLRFRQYLGAQYSNKINIQDDSPKGYAYPMVAVYLLGHRVGKIEEPVVYVNHDVYDYNGKVVKAGKDEPFVESLTHNSIIVQIPLLKGKVNNRLERVLSVFDQSQKDETDSQVLNIDEKKYENDSDMMYMLHILTAAAADSDMRQDMNVEDEYYKAIEDRDTAIMQRDKIIKERSKQIQQQGEKIQQQDDKIQQQDKKLREKETQLQQQDEKLREKNEKLQQQDEKLREKETQLQQQDEKLREKNEKLQQQDEKLREKDAQLRNIARTLSANGVTVQQISTMTGVSAEKVREWLG